MGDFISAIKIVECYSQAYASSMKLPPVSGLVAIVDDMVNFRLVYPVTLHQLTRGKRFHVKCYDSIVDLQQPADPR
jgi:hypothetical protein